MFKIEQELKNKPFWAKLKLAKEMWITPSAITVLLKKEKISYYSINKYTKGFNKAFNENKTEDYLFSKVEEDE